MIRCLIIKISSLGDIIHTLPALTDALNAIGDIQFDWVVEEGFQEIPSWHPAVNKVIPVALRRWKKNIIQSVFSSEWKVFKQQIRAQQYDVIIDAQGLLKSALLTRLVKGKTYGLDKLSAREAIASHFYQYPQSISRNQHAVERTRQLFAKALDYKLPIAFDYGLGNTITNFSKVTDKTRAKKNQILFFHGTTWETKHWPEQYWLQLARLLISDGYEILLPWGNEQEKLRAQRIKKAIKKPPDNTKIDTAGIRILPKMSLQEIFVQLIDVAAVVAVDTGLAHLAAALDIPLVSLFGPTNPGLTRPYGAHKGKQLQIQVDFACIACLKRTCSFSQQDQAVNKQHISPACYIDLTPDRVRQALYQLLENSA
ncbi:MAG: lipopolysaccharide heptosyltransferase I [Pseudomonadota bacterium]